MTASSGAYAHTLRRLMVAIFVVSTLIGCQPPASPSVVPTSAARFSLEALPPRPGCELVRIEYGSLMFEIQPNTPVTAVTSAGIGLRTAWDRGFVPDPSGELLIRDTHGEVVVRDGEVVIQPGRGFPRLNGHLVCVSFEVVWVFDEDPT